MLAVSIPIVAVRRPRLPRAMAPVLALCVIDALLIGRPFFQFGFGWIANANDDMANYVLSATDLLHHGLMNPVDVAGISHDRSLSVRSSTSCITRARVQARTSRFRPSRRPSAARPMTSSCHLILALNLCAVCGTAALAAQATRRSWVPSVAAALFVAAPLATFGVLAELMPQVWGLALSTSLFALLMRPELHRSPGARVRDLVPIAILAVAFIVVYVELAASLAAAYALYVAILVLQRKVDWRALMRLWGVVVIGALLFINSYLFRELHYVASQATGGVKLQGGASLFGFVLVPAELPAIVGLKPQDIQPGARFLDIAIVISILLLAAAAVAVLMTLRHGVAASCVLMTYLVLGVFLGMRSSGFGLFKLFMYVQPFLAAGIAVWLSRINRRLVFGAVTVCLVVLVGAQIHTGARYVRGSRNPIDLPHASASDLLPVFRRWFAASREPVISVTENPALAKLEAANIGNRSLYFISKFLFSNFVSAQEAGWKSHSIATRTTGRPRSDSFLANTAAGALLARGHCLIILPTGSQTFVNRLSLPEGSEQLVKRPCGGRQSDTLQNLLVFTSSSLGQAFYLPKNRPRVSFYQLESDYFYPGHTFSGFGRFALFRVLDPTTTVRLELWLTTTVRQDGPNRIPPADIVGTEKKGLPLVGRGSARVFSPPLVPQMIGGQPYVLLDMGTPGRLAVYHRTGPQGIYGQSIPYDPRYLTSYVRDISLISGKQYEGLRAPAVLSHFPADLANPNLEYSGIYEDGWVAEDFYAMLAGGRAGDLVIRANVLPQQGQHLEVLVNGRAVASRSVSSGQLALRVPVPRTASRRRIELRWARTLQLGPADRRKAAALLQFVGVVPATASAAGSRK